MPMKIEFTHDDVVSVKTALTKMGVSVPETDDLADSQILSMFRRLAERVRGGDYMMHRTFTQAELDEAMKAAKIEVYLDVMGKLTHIDKYTNSYWEYCRDAITELENG